MGYQEDFVEANRLHKQAQSLIDLWEGKKDVPADINKQIDDLIDASGTLFEQAEKAATRAEQMRTLDQKLHTPDASKALPVPSGADPASVKDATKARELAIFQKALIGGPQSLSEAERKDLSTINGPGGGYLVAPQTWSATLLQFVNDLTFIRARATKYQVPNAESLGYPSLETDIADADWTGEIATASADTALAFGKRELKPSPLSKLVKVSRPLLAKVPDAEGVVRARLAYKFAITEEKAFLTGTGANQPLGIFTASTLGIPTSQDQAAASSTVLAMDDLISTMFKLKAAYWKNAEWIMGRPVVAAVRKLKDTAGYYIWQPAQTPAVPSTLLERPLNISEYAPSTMTSGLYVAAYGDLSYYHIADSLAFQIQVLTELYALTNQNAYVARMEVDGLPALAEAFARLKMA